MTMIEDKLENGYEALSIEGLLEEMKHTFQKTEEGLQNMSWAMFDLLPKGTLLVAENHCPALRVFRTAFGAFEEALFEERLKPEDMVTIWPGVVKGDVVMFLGLTEKVYPYEVMVSVPRGRAVRSVYRPKKALKRLADRRYPSWLVNNKVFVYNLDMGSYKVLKMGSGDKSG